MKRFEEMRVPIPEPSRLHDARALVDSYDRAVAATPDPALLAEATRTIHEFYWIARACGPATGTAEERLRVSLARALSGPLDRRKEDEASVRARNTQFELFVGAWLTAGGVEPRLGEPDLLLRIGTYRLGVAAKRVRSRRKLVQRAKEAAEQVRIRSGQGIVALNVDSLLDELTLGGDAEAAGAEFNRSVPELNQVHEALFALPHVCGLLVLGTVVQWLTPGEEGRPSLHMYGFHRMHFFPNSDDEKSVYDEFLSSFRKVQGERLSRF